MHPEWQTVQRLLCCLAGVGVNHRVEPALQLLRQSLPQTQIMLLSRARAMAANAAMNTAIDIQPYFTITSDLSTDSTDSFTNCLSDLIETLRSYSFDVAIIFTDPDQSPYTLAYLCYLAAIPIRIGQSREFGGRVLSDSVTPPLDPVSSVDYHLHLLSTTGLCVS